VDGPTGPGPGERPDHGEKHDRGRATEIAVAHGCRPQRRDALDTVPPGFAAGPASFEQLLRRGRQAAWQAKPKAEIELAKASSRKPRAKPLQSNHQSRRLGGARPSSGEPRPQIAHGLALHLAVIKNLQAMKFRASSGRGPAPRPLQGSLPDQRRIVPAAVGAGPRPQGQESSTTRSTRARPQFTPPQLEQSEAAPDQT